MNNKKNAKSHLLTIKKVTLKMLAFSAVIILSPFITLFIIAISNAIYQFSPSWDVYIFTLVIMVLGKTLPNYVASKFAGELAYE